MNMHQNARLTPKGRELLIERLARGEHPSDVASAMGVSLRTVYKWRQRYRQEGLSGLADRSSRPRRSPTRTLASVEAKVVELRRQRRIYDLIANQTGLSRATVGRILVRHGLNRWRDLEPAEPVIRYERERPGEMIHIDIKKLGKFNRIGHRITGDRHGQSNQRQMAPPPAGSSSTSVSTTIPAWASPRSWATRKSTAPSPFSTPPWPGTPASASASNAS
jgi:transposase